MKDVPAIKDALAKLLLKLMQAQNVIKNTGIHACVQNALLL